jgi:hypothetical protein
MTVRPAQSLARRRSRCVSRPGKRTLAEHLPPIQRSASSAPSRADNATLANDIVYLFVKVDAGAAEHAGETGFVKMSDVKDKGDGKANVKLSYVDVKLTSAATKLYKAKDKKDVVVELAKDTRLKVVSTDGDMQQIEVVDGANVAKAGWIDKGQIKDEG